jgi:hypothetical protein
VRSRPAGLEDDSHDELDVIEDDDDDDGDDGGDDDDDNDAEDL